MRIVNLVWVYDDPLSHQCGAEAGGDGLSRKARSGTDDRPESSHPG